MDQGLVDRALGSGTDQTGVFGQHAMGDFGFGRCPAGAACIEIGIGFDDAACGIDDDSIAIAQQPYRAATDRFRRDMADDKAVARAAEAAIGHQGNLIAEPASDQGRGDGEHLAHAGAAGRTFVADDDDVAGTGSHRTGLPRKQASSLSKTRAGPSNSTGPVPDNFRMQPSGERLP